MPIRWTLYENGKKVKTSGDFNLVLNATTRTEDGIIYFGDKPVWVQVPDKHPDLYH